MFRVSRKCNTTVCILSLDIPYSAFPNSNSWQFSYPFCPSQGILPSSAVQSPLSLPCNNRSVSYALCSVSLLTMTAISADRLLALLLGLRYRQIVTVKCIHVISVFFWIASGVFALCQSLIYHITCWYGFAVTAFCLMISSASYTKIFRALSRHQTQIQDHGQQHPSQPNALNIARYRKAVHSALWVQLALFVCYLPYCIVVIFTAFSKISQTHLAVSGTLTLILVSFNSTLNPFLYCWKISEVRQAVKQTLRQGLCCL